MLMLICLLGSLYSSTSYTSTQWSSLDDSATSSAHFSGNSRQAATVLARYLEIRGAVGRWVQDMGVEVQAQGFRVSGLGFRGVRVYYPGFDKASYNGSPRDTGKLTLGQGRNNQRFRNWGKRLQVEDLQVQGSEFGRVNHHLEMHRRRFRNRVQ